VIYRQLGNTGVQVSELAIGTWQYRGGVEPLRAAIDLGINFIDTAESYGTEHIVGEAIRGLRERVFLASKISPRHFRERDVIRAAECSLKQLGTDYLDLYQLHWPNYTVPIGETMSAMEQLVSSGKIRFIGVSSFTVAEFRRAQAALAKSRIVSNQVSYSLVDRQPEEGLLDYCNSNQVSLLAYSPLGSNFQNLRVADPDDALGQVSQATGKTRAQVALQWCLSRPAVTAIFKANQVEHVRENCAASGWELKPDDLRLLETRIRHKRRSGTQQFARGLVRRAMQYGGLKLGNPTAADLKH